MGVNAGNSWENVKDALFLTALRLKIPANDHLVIFATGECTTRRGSVDPHSSKMLFNEGAYPCPHFPIWEPRAGFVGSLLSCTDDIAGTLLEHLLRDVAGVQWHQCCFRKLLTPTILENKKSPQMWRNLGMSKIYRRWCWKSSLLPR